ncbi:MAG TPA: NAD(P)/FAD-dependent oxidoreductase [Candidatus Dormibacteraeota bacterium]|nr:NAD(P)/FAD-dependent oxidoreductase [Candidatus Dormibacteraeota bacterium]
MADRSGRPRVVIVGAGFGGLACARKLDGEAVDVILLDQHNYHLFTPLLYQVATGLLNPSDIAYPLRTVFRHSSNVRFRQATVAGVDLARKVVLLAGGSQLAYDYLVLSTGSTDNYFGNQRLAEVSLSLKALEDATRLRNHVLTCLERADAETDMEARRALLTFVVVGGGPTGVESSGALSELMEIVAGKDYHQISRAEIRVILVEGTDRLLNAFSVRLGRYAQRVLARRGIEVRTGALVKSADDHSVTLSDGTTIACGTIIWSAGVRPNDPIGESPLPHFRNARIQVDEWLRIPGAPGAYGIGDVASPLAGDRELPMLSPPAMQAGRYVARTIVDEVGSVQGERKPFHYVDKGTMATVGRNAGVTHLPGGLEFTGFVGWLTWLFVHIYYLIGFRNRISALGSWAWGYLRHDRPIRIILAASSEPKRE